MTRSRIGKATLVSIITGLILTNCTVFAIRSIKDNELQEIEERYQEQLEYLKEATTKKIIYGLNTENAELRKQLAEYKLKEQEETRTP